MSHHVPGYGYRHLTEADVIAVPAQGIDAGADGFSEMIKAIKDGAAYVNVHSIRPVKYEVALAAATAREMKGTTTTEMTDTTTAATRDTEEARHRTGSRGFAQISED